MPCQILSDVEKIAPAAEAILLEEVQHLEEAGLVLKGLADRKIRKCVLATGSSSFELESRTQESLAASAEISSTPKIHFLDNGVRNLLLGMFQPLAQRPSEAQEELQTRHDRRQARLGAGTERVRVPE